MRYDEHRRFNTCNTRTSLPLLIILNSLLLLPRPSAQASFSAPSTLSTRPSVTMPPMTNLDPLSTSLSLLQPLSLTPVGSSLSPLQTYPGLTIAAEQPQEQIDDNTRVLNYYFLFIVLVAAALAAFLWLIFRHRKRKQELIRLRGQHALVQDVERWATRRRDQPPVIEGLDESGEAPPPYKPKSDTSATIDTVDLTDITRPPRALSRDEMGNTRLPDYSETDHAFNHNGGALPERRASGETHVA